MSAATTFDRRGAAIVGVGEVIPRGGDVVLSEESQLVAVIFDALADAGMSPKDIDGVCIPDPKLALRSWDVEESIGVELRFAAASPMEGPAGIGWCIREASARVDSGAAEAIVVYYGRNQKSQPQRMSPILYHAEDPRKHALEMPYGFYPQVAYMAAMFVRHAHDHGTTTDALAHTAIAARAHAMRHPAALRTTPLSSAEYYESRYISEPLRAADCSLVNDGAGAVVITSRRRAKSCARPPVVVSSTSLGHAANRYYYALGDPFLEGSGAASRDVFAAAGVNAPEVDLLYLFDAFTFMLLLQLEELGFCARGEVGDYVADVGIGPGAGQPVNTHGGCLSHAHVTGMNHVIEAVRQLRGEAGERQVPDARTALYSGFLWRDWCNVMLASP